MSTIGGGARQRIASAFRGAFRGYLTEQLFAQRDHYDLDPTKMTGDERAEWIVKNAHAAHVELVEMVQNVDGWKYWQNVRDDAGEFRDRAEFVDDGVDALKFLANMLLAAGATDEELSRAWAAKTDVNARRQVDGYRGVGKEHVLTEVTR